MTSISLNSLKKQLAGEVYADQLTKTLYATDASIYREMPAAVVMPKTEEDIRKTILFANAHQLAIIPRAAGTSLAGQCVGNGMVVDISKYFNNILELNVEKKWVRVQPGVIRDELNAFLAPYGLYFGPNTSTANRAMIGGMVGNNSCGTTSIKYGTTRDHVIELKTFLSDGSETTFGPLPSEALKVKSQGNSLEAAIYRFFMAQFNEPKQQEIIKKAFPKPGIHRRNTGYALDALLEMHPFEKEGPAFNMAKLLTGSEGTLAFTTEIKLQLDPLPPKHEILVCAHYNSIQHALTGVLTAMEHQPFGCEMMDKAILDCTKGTRAFEKNRFFLEGDPEAVIVVEVRAETKAMAEEKANKLIASLKASGLGYAFPKVYPPKTKLVWDLRKGGLGVLSNIPGDAKPVACIEDTAVALEDLPAYIEEFQKMMESFGQKAIYYAHAGAGELHLRPVLNLKSKADIKSFEQICKASAMLVKKYNGSLSGEHGDGRVRAPFIQDMVGKEVYELFRKLKQTWDPYQIFNPGKIVDPLPISESLRYEPGQAEKTFSTILDFSDNQGILRAAEKCNGSGDCRKLPMAGGTMCPSYQATRDEKDTTRARANVLREFLTRSERPNPFTHKEIREVMDLCLSCKGCTSECPSGVDIASMKAEFLHQYYQLNKIPFRSKVFGNINTINGWSAKVAGLSNFLLNNRLSGSVIKKMLGVAQQRSLPKVHRSLRNWVNKHSSTLTPSSPVKGQLYFFIDEFTNYNDVEIGKKAIKLLVKLGYEVKFVNHPESGRAAISKGLLLKAKKHATQHVELFAPLINDKVPLVGLEPSAILGFRDEFPRLVGPGLMDESKKLAQNALLIDEFLAKEIQNGQIQAKLFSPQERHLLLHGHCHQKALSDLEATIQLLDLPINHHVEVIPSGCCGMAGSFGYEKEHFEVSMKIGELVLFPAVRKAAKETTLVAPGTSCRHQILDGTGRAAVHPVEVLWEALL